MELTEKATRFLFFTGKGGVGKTSMACATALELACRGRRVLLVSTDPASNLDQVLGVKLSSEPTPVPSVAGLSALNINPEAAAEAYRDRVIGPYRGALPADAVAGMVEQLSGACTVEVAAFDEFTGYIVDEKTLSEFDHVIFDTAPTGHTLRLLQLPAAWSGFLATNERGSSCLGPLSGLKTQQEKYAATVAALSDERMTTLVLVTRPERSAIDEAGARRSPASESAASTRRLRPRLTGSASSKGPAKGSTPTPWRCSRKTSVRPAQKRSRSSMPFPESSPERNARL